MIGFKLLDEFTFDDCVKSIERRKSEGITQEEELLERYNTLLETLKYEEKRDYKSVKTIDGLKRYIKKYTVLPGATKYQPEYLDIAKKELEKYRHKRDKKQRVIIYTIIGIFVFIIAPILIYIGYRPVGNIDINPSLNSRIELNSFSLRKEFNIVTSKCNNGIRIDSSCDWCKVEKHGDNMIITVDKNIDDARRCNIVIYSYNMLYGIELDRVSKKIEIIQASGKATFLDISKNRFVISKFGTKYVNSNHTFTITTDGSEIVEPLIANDNWVKCYRALISTSPLEIKYTLEIEENPSSERTFEMQFTTPNGSIVKNVTIYQQSGCANYFRRKDGDGEIYVRKESLPEGKCYAIDIETDGTSWAVVSCPNWITYKIVGNRLEIYPTTWIPDNSKGIEIGRYGDIILRSNNSELADIVLSINQGLLD